MRLFHSAITILILCTTALAQVPTQQRALSLPAFVPNYNIPGRPLLSGLKISVGTGTLLINGTPTTYAATTLTVDNNTTTYVYVDLNSGLLTQNTTGFTSNMYPICTAVATGGIIVTLTDNRPDVFGSTASASVTSVFGRTGVITAQSGDYTASQVTNAIQLQGAAPTSGNCTKWVDSTHVQDFGFPCVAPSAIPTQVVQSGLLAEYRMTEGSGTTLVDYSGNANNGTFPGGANNPTWLATTGGLSFAGNQFVTLPAAILNALTIQIYFTYQPLAAPSALVPTLFVNQSSQYGVFLWSKAQDYSQGTQDGAYYIFSRGNASCHTRTGPVGTGMITVALNSSSPDVFFENGTQLDFGEGTPCATGNAGSMVSGALQLGGSATAFAGNTFFTGNIYYAVFYNRALTSAEIQQNYQFISQVMAVRSAPVSLASTSTTNQLVTDGDSITEAQNFGSSFAAWSKDLQLTNGSWNIANVGTTGSFLSPVTGVLNCPTGLACGLQTDAILVVDPVLNTHSANSAVTIWAGTNDLAGGGGTAAQVFGQLGSYCRQRRLIGAKCIVVTMMSRTGQDTNKNSYDTLIRGGWQSFADGLADVAADPNLGADGANASATYFQTDHIHPTSFASHNDIAPIIQRAVNRIFGNLDFSSANTYASAAAAATATTAGSEATNTVTITFGATPANCITGSIITLAGITPAGYNGNYQILSRTATQITYFNSTTGLGAITVQGTGVCPEQVDADVYTKLNFGAGNFTLQSCQGYTGQNLYIKNINAGASTVVPFGSETIDGASSVSVAANATLVLQSILVSSSAGGCNWKQLQNN